MIYLTLKKLPDNISAIQLYEKAVSVFAPSDANAKYINKLSERIGKSARESLFALILLAKLAERAGASPRELVLRRNENGKPYFEDSKLKFSISHSGEYVAVALSDECDVGIDMETADIDGSKAIKMAKRFFTEKEQAEIERDPSLFRDIWRKKEATAKCLGVTLERIIRDEKNATPRSAPNNEMRIQNISIEGIAVTVCTGGDNSTAITVADI